MKQLIKQIVESKFNFNIDTEGNEDSLTKSRYSSLTLKLLIELKDCIIDLGLPSGIRWAKYNLGVDPNKLSKPEDWYGDYYAWGETESKPKNIRKTGWANYKFCKCLDLQNRPIFTKYLTKYKVATGQDITYLDNLTHLLPEDDAAYQNKKIGNFKFKMPTKADFNELIEETNNEWIEDFNSSGVNGYKFTNKLNSSKYIFLPAAGCYHDSNLDKVSVVGGYWSSSLDTDFPKCAKYLYFDHKEIYMEYSSLRYNGFSVRPVLLNK